MSYPSNYRPVTCLPMVWKILVGHIKEDITLLCVVDYFLKNRRYRSEIRVTRDLLYIDQYILKEIKENRKNLAMIWIDYKKAYDMIPQTLIIEFLKMYNISDLVINFLAKVMKNWKVDLTARGQTLEEVKIQRGVFQGDSLSPQFA